MGIGRLAFLRLTGLAMIGLAVDPYHSVIVNGDTYVNKRWGILFNKPSGWNFVAVKEFDRLKEEQILCDEMELIKEDLWEMLEDPICIATKYSVDDPTYKGVFSPTITLNVIPKNELEELEQETIEEVMKIGDQSLEHILKEYKVIKRYSPYYLNGSMFYETDAEYMFEHLELNAPVKVELKSIHIEHNANYYSFNCHQSKSQNQHASIEFEKFKNTIKLV